jgi:integrase
MESSDAADESVAVPEKATSYSFTAKLAGGAERPVTAFRRAPDAPWTIKPRQNGKQVWRSLKVMGSGKADLALVRKRATAIIQELIDSRFAAKVAPVVKAKAFATIGEMLKAYKAGIRIETEISEDVVRDNCRRLNLLVAEALKISHEAALEKSAAVLTLELVERFQDGRLAKVQKADAITRGRTRRTMDGLLNKARSLVTTQALAVYRKAGLTLPDLKRFKDAPMKGNWNSNAYVPIEDSIIAKMDKAAWGELRTENPEAFLTYLMMLRLGMRNSEVECVRRSWIERKTAWVLGADGKPAEERLAFMAITERPGWDGPKNGTNRRVPIAPDVLAAIEELGGEDYLLDGTPFEREEITHRDVCDFVRRFLPSMADDAEGGRVKAAYELRKHFGALVASTQGLDRAAEYLGDRRDTVERHYHAWLQNRSARPLLAAELTPKILAMAA